MKTRQITRRLREYYPQSKITTVATTDGRGCPCRAITRNGRFVAWIHNGQVDMSLINLDEIDRKGEPK